MSKLLIVEDNPLERLQLQRVLVDAGYAIETAESAEAAYDRLRDETFDLVVCDLQLPGDNGFDLCRRLRQDSRWQTMPIILLTRFSDPRNVLRGLEAGADGFISKGQSTENIVERVRRVLMQSQAARTENRSEASRVVFLDTEFEVNASRAQLLEILLAGYEDAVYINEQYEREANERALAQKSARSLQSLYASLVESLPVSVTRRDREGRYTFANRHFCDFVQRPIRDILKCTDQDLFPAPLAAARLAADQQTFAEAMTHDSTETHALPDGGTVYLRTRRIPVRDAHDSIVGVQEVSWDVSVEQRAQEHLRLLNATLESRVAERTAELQEYARRLEATNAELDQFVFIASHDLQEPVRKLISFSELLEEDLAEGLNDRVRTDLFYIKDAARRMRTLVQDLLVYSRSGRSALKRERVCLGDCVHGALNALSLLVQDTNAEIVCEPLPAVVGDRTMLTQLFQNLIGNALKFVADRRPVVRISARPEGDHCVCTVRDNGIGIDPEHAEQIFAPFQRLHSRDQYEGSGIGLAICKTTVQRHGGRIWVEPNPEGGSQFHFTIPLAATIEERASSAASSDPAPVPTGVPSPVP